MEKHFVDLNGYEGIYQISTIGEIKSIDRVVFSKRGFYMKIKGSKIAVSYNGNRGYPTVELRKNGQRKTHFVHRLMLMQFVPNPCNKKYANHKNGNKFDYSLENLEWVTGSENHKHAYEIGLKRKPFKPTNPLKGENHQFFNKKGELSHNSKIILDTQTGIFYFGATEAAKAKGFNLPCFRRKLWGGRTNNTGLIYV